MAYPQAWKRLMTIAVLLSLCSALFISTNTKTQAAGTLQSTSKVSPDLRKLIASGNGDRRVKLIVQTKPAASPGLLGSLLNTVGGVLVGMLSNLNIQLIETPPMRVRKIQSPVTARVARRAATPSIATASNTTII